MSKTKRGVIAPIDIDALLQDTWLQVVSLRHGPTFQEEKVGCCGSAALQMSSAFSWC